MFGLTGATIAEIISATRTNLGKRPTLNRVVFGRATGSSGRKSVDEWRLCLAAGDAMAHFGLGCALCEVGEYREAFQHLRHDTHIAPVIAWNWRWYGYAAENRLRPRLSAAFESSVKTSLTTSATARRI